MSTLAASLRIEALASQTPATPLAGDRFGNMTDTTYWTAGKASGQVDRNYFKARTLAAAATHSYNTLAAGSLTDIDGQTIDLDELKAIRIKVTSGSIKWVGTTGTPIGLFLAAGDGIKLAAGHDITVNFGAVGLDVTANSLFEITDTAGGSGSAYTIWFIGAQ